MTRPTLAFDVYVHQLRRGIGAMIASLGGLDVLVFTGGVGEHAPEVRAAAAEPFAGVEVLVVDAREDLEIARGSRQSGDCQVRRSPLPSVMTVPGMTRSRQGVSFNAANVSSVGLVHTGTIDGSYPTGAGAATKASQTLVRVASS